MPVEQPENNKKNDNQSACIFINDSLDAEHGSLVFGVWFLVLVVC